MELRLVKPKKKQAKLYHICIKNLTLCVLHIPSNNLDSSTGIINITYK